MGAIRTNRLFLQTYLLIIVSAILLNAVGQYSQEIMNSVLFPAGGNWLGYLTAAMALLVPSFFVFRSTIKRAGQVLGPEVDVVRSNRQKPVEFLLMGYSPLPTIGLDELLAEIEAIGGDNVSANSRVYEAACRTMRGREPLRGNVWQQNLRSAWHHREKLRAIYVLDPDEEHFSALRTYLTAGLGAGRGIEIIRISSEDAPGDRFLLLSGSGEPLEPSYEDYNYVYEGLRRGLAMIRERPDVKEPGRISWLRDFLLGTDSDDEIDKRTCVDATPGQKPFSIAAAILTINRPLKFSYVTTSNPKDVYGEVKFYDTNLRIAGAT